MRHALIIIISCFFGTSSYTQGAWNIRYIEIDSVTSDFLNTKIKLDFKHDWLEMKNPKIKHVRHFVCPEDTAFLFINNNKVVVIERRAIYPDHGLFSDQFLELENCEKSVSERIYNTEIVKFEEDRMKVRVVIDKYVIGNDKIEKELDSQTLEFWIEKEKLDGIIIEE